jgi:hypothetical protein
LFLAQNIPTVDIGKSFLLGGDNCTYQGSTLVCTSRSIKNVPAFQSLGGFISAVLPSIFVISGIILFVLIVFGGLTMILNAGSGDAKKVEQGQQALTSAMIGMVVIFCAWWIIKIIEYLTGITIF